MYRTSNDGTHLAILNVTRNTTGYYECHIELNDGSLVEGETYDMEPLGMLPWLSLLLYIQCPGSIIHWLS